MPIGELEGLEWQIRMLDSMPEAQQLAQLDDTLAHNDELSSTTTRCGPRGPARSIAGAVPVTRMRSGSWSLPMAGVSYFARESSERALRVGPSSAHR